MSLINEALKRASEDGQPLTLTPPALTPTQAVCAESSVSNLAPRSLPQQPPEPMPSAAPLPMPTSYRSINGAAIAAASLVLLVLAGAYYIWRVEQGGPTRTLAMEEPQAQLVDTPAQPIQTSVAPAGQRTDASAQPLERTRAAIAPAAMPAVAVAAVAPAPTSQPQYKLSGVLQGDEGPVAIVNGQSVRPGESVDNAMVLKVTASSVELVCQDGRRVTLRL